MQRWLQAIIVACSVVLLIGSLFVGMNGFYAIDKPMLQHESKPTVMLVHKSMTALAFTHQLKRQGLIASTYPLLWLIRLEGAAQRLKAGVYEVKPGESARQFLHRVLAGDVLIESFPIIAGTTQTQISERLKEAPYLLYRSTDWLSIADTHPNAEGLLLADTYRYNAGSEAQTLLHQARASLMQYLETMWQQRTPGLPYKTPYELLIAASILEKEAAIPQEKRLISGIIVNRLRKNMLLQMDPTVIYALGSDYHGKLTRADLYIDSPYNSYRYKGLPPTPIAMVGKDALDAAAHPLLTQYLYFVARGDGTHDFSATYDEQKQAVMRYQRKSDHVK